jgi:hypothetical protein
MVAELGGQAASRQAVAGDGAACGGYQRVPRAGLATRLSDFATNRHE